MRIAPIDFETTIMGQNIFISYRRADSEGYAGRIYGRLQESFGLERVFENVTDIGVGEDFADAINQAINSCRVVIVLIGPIWHSITDEMGRKRLEDPHDFVRMEVQAALESDVLVVPVLVHGAHMPKAKDLPVELQSLTYRRAIEIRHRQFENDVENFVHELEKHLSGIEQNQDVTSYQRVGVRIPVWGWLLIVFVFLIVGISTVFWWRNGRKSSIGSIPVSDTPQVMIAVKTTEIVTTTPRPPTATTTKMHTQTPPPTATHSPTVTSTPTRTPTETPLPSQMDDPFGVTMILIPQGPIIMGTDEQNPWNMVSRPAHSVNVEMFYIDKYEISNAQYASCVQAGVCQPPRSNSSKTRNMYFGDPQYADYPVIFVSWHDAQTYCSWRGGRLPGEEEWEKAARGGDQRVYPWGTDPVDCQRANFAPNKTCAGDTLPIDSHPTGVSPFGAHNLSGNVAEWVNDWLQSYPGGNPNASKAFGITHRIARGGAYFDGPNYVQTTIRQGLTPDSAFSYVGFRCVLDIDALP
jgi:formylglycine-generating enzyme required for sulfatase activity